MRQVQTCDFCGADAAGLFEPLPASIPDSPRLALCAGCRDRLASVLDPLLARLEDDAAPADADAGSGDRPATDGSGATAERSSGVTAAPPSDDGVGGSRDAGGRSKADRGGTPPGYRKAMRFLENRQLPVEREEAEVLVADAYDLTEEEVAAVIDHAVQYGRLRAVDGELKR